MSTTPSTPPTGELRKRYQDIIREVIKLNGEPVWLDKDFLYTGKLVNIEQTMIDMQNAGYIKVIQNIMPDENAPDKATNGIPHVGYVMEVTTLGHALLRQP